MEQPCDIGDIAGRQGEGRTDADPANLARPHVKAVLTGESADELFAYVDRSRKFADELTLSLGTNRTQDDRLRGECLRDRHLIVAQMDVCSAQ